MSYTVTVQAHKIYVQDRLRESADLVWELLEVGAHFYVCGDAAHMAGAVEQALLDCITRAQVPDQLPPHLRSGPRVLK
jgi:sulfite reductase alpha subunit-like flavoprotein